MKKILKFSTIILVLLIVVSCTQYRFWPPIMIPENDSTPYDVSSPEEFTTMLTGAGEVRLTDDIVIDGFDYFEAGKSYDIDLNNHKLSFDSDSSVVIGTGATVSISNGSLYAPNISKPNDEYRSGSFFAMQKNSTLIFDGVIYEADSSGIALGTGKLDSDSATDAHLVIRNNSEIIVNGVYAIGTNASTVEGGEEGETVTKDVDIDIIDSVITANGVSDYDSCGVILNVPGSINIVRSIIIGDRQGLVVRGGNAVITDSKIYCSGKYNPEPSEPNYYLDKAWGSGSELPFAALIVGNRGGSYEYPSSCTVLGSSMIEMQGSNPNGMDIYISSDGYDAKLTVADSYAKDITDNNHYWGKTTYVNDLNTPLAADESGNPVD